MTLTEKECRGCFRVLPTESFYSRGAKCKECVCADRRDYYRANRDAVRTRVADYKKTGRPKELRQRNVEHHRAKERDSARRNQSARTEYMRERRRRDPLFRIASNMRSRISGMIREKGLTKRGRFRELLGCSFEDFATHLEEQFAAGMCWDNYGEWHVDHIIPMASAKTIDELEKLQHFTNLQPLWALDNFIKRNTTDLQYITP